ncbi:MAG: ABC transporter transmembrane domain-containing protein [Alphaproteobacteria bacterium]|nr:ABC transporter transmembrane domain-containing protein [Alphaproteobacteria bacterium]
MSERLERSMYSFVLRYSRRQQLYILIFVVLSWPIGFMLLDLPKQIINRALGAAQDVYSLALLGAVEIPLAVSQPTFLLALCLLFLSLVALNNGLKFHINTTKGRTAERLLRRLRYALFSRVLRFPIPHFKRASQGEVISMITAESEPIGAFFVGAVVDPIFQGGLLLVALGFIVVQDPMLGAAAAAFYPLQIYVVPRLQKKVSVLGKARLRQIRHLSDHVGETVGGIVDIHANDTSNLELTRFADRLGAIYNIRFEIFQRKFMIKFINNFLDKLAPFLFYLFGGLLVIKGSLDIGQLVAVLGAHREMSAPWKAMLNWYQQQADARVKYDQVVSQFDVSGMLDDTLQHANPEEGFQFEGDIELSNVSLLDEDEVRRLANLNIKLPIDGNLAVAGAGSSGKEYFGMLLARLETPSSGQLMVAGRNIVELPQSVTGRKMTYVSSSPFLQSATVRDNLLYGLKYRPLRPATYDDDEVPKRQRDLLEAAGAGNIDFDYRADWIDYEAAGVSDPAELFVRIIQILDVIELSDDIYGLGLRGTIDPDVRGDIATAVLKARGGLADKLEEEEYRGLVEKFDRATYNTNASVAENLLFGTTVGDAFNHNLMAENAYVLEVLREADLIDEMLKAGREVAETMIEIFADLPPGHEFFEQYSFISSEDLPEFKTLLSRTDKYGSEDMRPEDRAALLSLPFKLVTAQHRLGIVDEALQQKILKAREIFAEKLPEDLKGAVEFFDPEGYNAAGSLQDNILLGKLVYGQAGAGKRIGALIADTLDNLGLRGAVLEAGLEFQVGVGGARLSSGQRQKVGLARALLKQSDMIVLSESTSALDPSAQDRLAANILKARDGQGVVWIVNRVSMASKFDRVIVLDDGRVAEDGTYVELDKDGTALRGLLESA